MAKDQEKAKQKKTKAKGLWSEFKAFISKGNVLDMAVGVIIGGAFSAIVTAVVNVLLSVCTWGVPGGLAGLVTILPPAPGNAAQYIEIAGWLGGARIQSFKVSEFADVARAIGHANGAADEALYGANYINANFTKYGGQWIWNGAAIINWGALINAVISFLIIAITLFIIVKVASVLSKKRDELKAQALEEYYTKHPEERPVPPEPGKPEPTTNELLGQIRDLLAGKAPEEDK